MTLKHLCAAAAVAGCLLSIASPTWARGGMGGASRGVTSSVTTSTSGALPRLPSSGALPQLPTSGALPSTPTLPIVGPSLGASSTLLVRPQPPMPTPRAATGAPYQPPCGAYPLPQC